MLPSLKKSGKKNAGDSSLAWHPNFRNAEVLPDTKTVRTKFFIHVIVIAITLGLGLSGALREFKLSGLRVQLMDIEEHISASNKASNDAVATYKLFQAQEKIFNEAYGFVSSPFRFSEFIIRLGGVMPAGAKIRRIDYRGPAGGVIVAASVKGLDARASDDVSAFVQLVKSDTFLTKNFPLVTLKGLARSVTDEAMSFELAFAPKQVTKSTAPGGAAQ